jgi:hypothetical protein
MERNKGIIGYVFCIIAVAMTTLVYASDTGASVKSDGYRARMASVDVSSTFEQAGIPSLDLLPTGKEWITHIQNDLLPFWTTPAALGNPIGNFPTFRADDGSVIDINNLPKEVKAIDPSEKWLLNRINPVSTHGIASSLCLLRSLSNDR